MKPLIFDLNAEIEDINLKRKYERNGKNKKSNMMLMVMTRFTFTIRPKIRIRNRKSS
jgi:hypothetical protein